MTLVTKVVLLETTDTDALYFLKLDSGVTGFFSDIFPSDCTMVLGSTQPLVKMSTRNVSWGYRRPVHEDDSLSPYVPNIMEIWEPKPPGTLWAKPGLLRDSFTFTFKLVSSGQHTPRKRCNSKFYLYQRMHLFLSYTKIT